MEYNRQTIHLLTLEHSPNDVDRWIKLFRNAGFPARIEYISSLDTLENALEQHQWDAILSVEETPAFSAQQVLRTIQHQSLDIPVIVILPEYDAEKAATWLSIGAKDAIPFASEAHILQAVEREIATLNDRKLLKTEQQKLTEANNRCELLLASTSEAIAYIHYGMHVDANQAYLEFLGYENTDDLIGLSLIDLVHADSREYLKQQLKQFQPGASPMSFECQLVHNDGHFIPASIKLSEAQYDNEPCTQITIQPAAVPVLNQVVTSEVHPVSPREQLFTQGAEQILSSKQSTLIWLQVDDYDKIRRETNISGILSIQQSIADLVKNHFPDALSCHYGDDVFLILDTQHSSDEIHHDLCELQAVIEGHLFGTAEETLTISTAAGFARPEDTEGLNDLITNAQTAHGQALLDDEQRVKQYSPMEIIRNKALSGDIQATIEQALTEENFQLAYQPVINVTGTDEQHYEVSVHIPLPDDRSVKISDYLEAIELSNLMPLVIRWEIRQCVLELSTRQKEGAIIPRLIVNLCQWSLQDSKFLPYLSNLFKATGLPPESLILQVTETTALQQLKGLVSFSNKLDKIGCLLAIDSFQADSRSIKLLQHLKVNTVHLDTEFIKQLGRAKNAPYMERMNALRKHNTHCIARDIDSSQSIALLWRVGIQYAQGKYIGTASNAMDYEFE